MDTHRVTIALFHAVLDSDAFEAFKEIGNVFDSNLSSRLRKEIYEKVLQEEAMDLYVNFEVANQLLNHF